MQHDEEHDYSDCEAHRRRVIEAAISDRLYRAKLLRRARHHRRARALEAEALRGRRLLGGARKPLGFERSTSHPVASPRAPSSPRVSTFATAEATSDGDEPPPAALFAAIQEQAADLLATVSAGQMLVLRYVGGGVAAATVEPMTPRARAIVSPPPGSVPVVAVVGRSQTIALMLPWQSERGAA